MALCKRFSQAVTSASCSMAITLVAVMGLAGSVSESSEMAMSCFVISGQMSCIDVGAIQVAPVTPSVMGPIGPVFGGEDEDIVMHDDGGYEVERG